MEKFQLNSKIELVTGEGDKTSGLIQDKSDDKLFVSIPPDDREFKIIRVGEKLQCIVYDKKRVLAFDALMTQRIFADIPTYELSNLSNFYKIQRRQAVRVPCSMEIYYSANKYLLEANRKVTDDSKIIDHLTKYVSYGITLDLSAGGLRFSCDDNFNIGQNLLLLFVIEEEKILIKSTIVYKDMNVAPQKTIYTYGMKFLHLSESRKEKIINYLFVVMRKNRLK